MSDTTMTVVDGAATRPALLTVCPVRFAASAGAAFGLERRPAVAGAVALGAAGAAKADDAAIYGGSTRGLWATAGADIDQVIGAVRRPVTTDHNSTFRGHPRGLPV